MVQQVIYYWIVVLVIVEILQLVQQIVIWFVGDVWIVVIGCGVFFFVMVGDVGGYVFGYVWDGVWFVCGCLGYGCVVCDQCFQGGGCKFFYICCG